MLTRKTAIKIALEATAGTDPAIGDFSPMLAWDVELDVRGELLERSIMRDTISPIGSVVGLKDQGLTFKTELKAGDPGSVPEMDLALVACGFGTAAHSGTAPIVYTLKSEEADLQSVSLLVYKDGNMHKIVGARGTVRFVMEAGQFGVCEWDMNGLYNAVVAITHPDLSAIDETKPPIIYASNFNIGGFSPVCNSAVIDLGNQVARRDDLNSTYGVKEYRITGRTPKLEFNADAVVEASNPFWGDWSGDVIDTFGIVVGSTAGLGQQVILTGFYKLDTNKYGDAEGVSQYECVASLVSSTVNSQNDELKVQFNADAVT